MTIGSLLLFIESTFSCHAFRMHTRSFCVKRQLLIWHIRVRQNTPFRDRKYMYSEDGAAPSSDPRWRDVTLPTHRILLDASIRAQLALDFISQDATSGSDPITTCNMCPQVGRTQTFEKPLESSSGLYLTMSFSESENRLESR